MSCIFHKLLIIAIKPDKQNVHYPEKSREKFKHTPTGVFSVHSE